MANISREISSDSGNGNKRCINFLPPSVSKTNLLDVIPRYRNSAATEVESAWCVQVPKIVQYVPSGRVAHRAARRCPLEAISSREVRELTGLLVGPPPHPTRIA